MANSSTLAISSDARMFLILLKVTSASPFTSLDVGTAGGSQ